MKPVTVLFSGGQDSTTCLAWAIEEFGREGIHTVGFDYDQKHSIELECAENIVREFNLPNPHTILPIPVLGLLGGAALTDDSIEVEAVASEDSANAFAYQHGLPSTFVPGRNVLFLATAAAFSAQRGIYDLVTGVCEADASGYPDCRRVFIDAMEESLAAALDEPEVTIWTPLVKINKALTWKMANDLGVLNVIRDLTHTCYHGVHDGEHYHEWGYGCGECPACIERAKGYTEFMGEKARA